NQIKSPYQLRGKVIAVTAQGSVTHYELGKILTRRGMDIGEGDVKFMTPPQMAVALANKTIDAAKAIPPFVWHWEEHRITAPYPRGDEMSEARPLTVSVIMINTDFAKKNIEAVQNYFAAWVRGVRDYCQGYHGGPIRNVLVDEMLKSGLKPELLHR